MKKPIWNQECTLFSPAKVPLYHCTQHEQQTGGVGSLQKRAMTHLPLLKLGGMNPWLVLSHRLLRRDRTGRRVKGVALYNSWIECNMLSLRNSHEQAESCGQESETNAIQRALWSVSTKGCLTKGSLLTKPFCSSCRRHCAGGGSHPSGELPPPWHLPEKQYSEL